MRLSLLVDRQYKPGFHSLAPTNGCFGAVNAWSGQLLGPCPRMAITGREFESLRARQITEKISNAKPIRIGPVVGIAYVDRSSYGAYCASPLPNDQFSFFTSTRLMTTSSRRSPRRA